MSNFILDNQWKEYISEWISIQNIVSNKNYDKEFLEILTSGNKDDCETKDENNCNSSNKDSNKDSNTECKIYNSSKNTKICVNAKRIKKFKTPGTIIFGKNGLEYICLETKKLQITNTQLLALKIDINQYNTHLSLNKYTYYYILKSNKTNNIYILFPTGDRLDIIDNTYLTTFLTDLISKIKIYQNYNKIILAGHSFGCNLALYTGILLNENDNVFFNNNCIVLGSGQYKFIKNNTFHDLPNVKIFALALNIEPIPVIDNFLNYIPIYTDKVSDYYYYEPIIFLDFKNVYKNENENENIIIDIDLKDNENYMSNEDYVKFLNDTKNDQAIYNDDDTFFKERFNTNENIKIQSFFLHSWDSYFKSLSKLVNLQNTSIKGGKKCTRRKRKNKKCKLLSRKTRIKI